jgi:hypothetical protein
MKIYMRFCAYFAKYLSKRKVFRTEIIENNEIFRVQYFLSISLEMSLE